MNFLDVTFNLTNGTYKPYMKPNNQPLYVNVRSNHPPSILKHLPDNINHRLSDISCNEEAFNSSKRCYQRALQASGYTEELSYSNPATRTAQKRPKNRRRNIIWYNPPYNKNVRTNVGKQFLNLIEKHFAVNNKHHKIFNKNNVKVSYGCCQNMENIVKQHNSKILNESNTINDQGHTCNCRVREQCPLDNNCLSSGVVYMANVSTDDDPLGKSYIGLTEGPFKLRFNQHTSSFKREKHSNCTELSKHVWKLKNKGKQYNIKWSIITKASPYNNKSKRCNLCIAEKFHILNFKGNNLLNKRDELVSKCRHENKFYITNYKNGIR